MSARELTQDTADPGDGVTERSRSRVCTFHYRGGSDGNSSSARRKTQLLSQALQQQQQQRLAEESAGASNSRMPSNREMPSYEEWKRRRANKPFGEEVVLLELDPKEELARRRLRDQRLMSLLQPDEQDAFYTYLDHYERVQAKVEQEREARERQKTEAARQASAEAERRKREQHKLRKRLEKVTLTTDKEFRADVAKSKYYRLVQQERRRGFKSRDEQDQFWQSRLQSEGLLRPEAIAGDAAAYRGEAKAVDEAQEEADEALPQRLTWEKTDDALQIGGAGSVTPGRSLHQSSMSRAQQNRLLEELFPRVERPKLTSFDVDFSKKEEKTPEELELERLQEKRRHRLEEWREHRHMQQMAVTFGVTTRRILDERPVRDSADRLMEEVDGDLGQLFGEALERARRRQEEKAARAALVGRELDLTDPRLIQPWRKPARRRQPRQDLMSLGSSTRLSSAAGGPSGGVNGAAAADRPLTTPATHSSGIMNEDSFDMDFRQPKLLSMNQAHHLLPSVEAKGQSSLWSNYMGAGNVRFAPLDEDQWLGHKGAKAKAVATG